MHLTVLGLDKCIIYDIITISFVCAFSTQLIFQFVHFNLDENSRILKFECLQLNHLCFN